MSCLLLFSGLLHAKQALADFSDQAFETQTAEPGKWLVNGFPSAACAAANRYSPSPSPVERGTRQ